VLNAGQTPAHPPRTRTSPAAGVATSITISGLRERSNYAEYNSTLPGQLRSALDNTPVSRFTTASGLTRWGSHRHSPASGANVPILNAVSYPDLPRTPRLLRRILAGRPGRWTRPSRRRCPPPRGGPAAPVPPATCSSCMTGSTTKPSGSRSPAFTGRSRLHGCHGLLAPEQHRADRLEHDRRFHHLRATDRPAGGVRPGPAHPVDAATWSAQTQPTLDRARSAEQPWPATSVR